MWTAVFMRRHAASPARPEARRTDGNTARQVPRNVIKRVSLFGITVMVRIS